MMYTPQAVANYFLDKAEEHRQYLTQLKLVKLVFLGYAWQLALNNRKLFAEPIEAWKHGPVVPSIYHEFKHFGRSPITTRSLDLFYSDEGEGEPSKSILNIDKDDADTKFVLDKVWAAYRHFTGWDLRNITHRQGTPWSKVYKPDKRGITLMDTDIKEYYFARIGQYLDAANA